jgi:ATP synthase protein I
MPFNRSIPASKPRTGLSSGISGLIEAEKLLQIAFVMPAAVLIGWAAGWWLGHLLHQKWIEIAGVVFGCVSGLFYVIQTAIAAEKKTSMGDEARNGDDKGTPNLRS